MRKSLPVVSGHARAQLVRLHGAVDTMTAPLVAQHRDHLQCARGCHACCVDDISVFALEADRIVEHHAELLETGVAHPEGACAFLDSEGACRIYEHRPYVCRTQGLPLRWLEEQGDELVELRDCCALNFTGDAGALLTALPEEQCFTLGPVEQRLRDQAEHASAAERVPLRSLFRS